MQYAIPRRTKNQRRKHGTPELAYKPQKPAVVFKAPGRTRPRSERVKPEKPVREAKRQRAIRAISDQARAMLSIIRERTVYRNRDGSGHYWLDAFMQGVGYIEKALLTELRKLKLIREQAGLFVATLTKLVVEPIVERIVGDSEWNAFPPIFRPHSSVGYKALSSMGTRSA